MIPGSVSKLSESELTSANTIAPKSDIVVLSGTTQINTITPALGTNVAQFLVLVPAGSTVLSTTGNIAVGITAVVNRPVFMVYSPSVGKWLINSGV